MRKRRFFSTMFLCVVLVAGLVVYVSTSGKGGGVTAASVSVRLNEVMTSNKGSVPDGLGNFPDWVELYNPSDKEVDISGYGLSDNVLEGGKYVFPAGTKVEPNG
ncbi:MAG: lamin tail domain-containing protein, partial [Clostridia bacterium]|nr:lamin tail domain-containing protein [Clostridia bacterium]